MCTGIISALNSSDSGHFFYQTRPQDVLGLMFYLAPGPNTRRHVGPRVQRPLGKRKVDRRSRQEN